MNRPLAIVTGTSRGIGAAVVHALDRHGFDVVGVARGAPDAAPPHYRHFACDLSDTQAVTELFERRVAQEVDLDRARVGLVNNAARLDVGTVPATQLAHFATTLTLNVAVPVYLHGWLLRHAPRAALRVVDISSGAAYSAYAGWASYCASKAALDMAGQVLATEVAEVPAMRGADLRVVSYSPGVVNTAMQGQLRDADADGFPNRDRFVELHEGGALLDPAQPAEEIARLLLDDDLAPFSRRRCGEA